MTTVSALISGLDTQFFTEPEENLYDFAGRLLDQQMFGAIVRDKDGDVVGVVTEHDMVREAFLKNAHLYDITVGQAMTENAVMCQASTDLAAALALMGKHRIRHLVVKDGEAILGFVSIKDILQKVHADQQLEILVLRDIAGMHSAA
ncbi:cyclic nucleotide-binding/CBS domain-containing protein [Leisingera sp. ANG59]|uniref:CBS domain-containing protein n=1 Tax=Leisingera sp. ANG59 TaxID=2675221 RepID=UPI0015716B51|nr:CBS domain-containing protein [Leisingera sp. ANG59]NSY41586.1 CBS domain-containing protein [Leisingera sp. ANG59]